MFHFPGFPPPRLYIQRGVTPHHGCRVPPFGHPRINARLTAPRGLSRPPTSFIGSWYQGIHHAPLNTYTHAHSTQTTPHRTTSTGPRPLAGTTHTLSVRNTFTGNQHTTNAHHPHPPHTGTGGKRQADARIHYPVHKHPPTNPTTIRPRHTPPTPAHAPRHTGRHAQQEIGGGYEARDRPGTESNTPPTPAPAQRRTLRTSASTRGGGLSPQDPTARRPPTPAGPGTPEKRGHHEAA